MSTWRVELIPEAQEDLRALDNSQRTQVIKAIKKVSANPLPTNEGGLGKPLGSHSGNNLAGYLKIKLLKLGLRVVYRIVRGDNVMKIIVISLHDDGTVYKMVRERIK